MFTVFKIDGDKRIDVDSFYYIKDAVKKCKECNKQAAENISYEIFEDTNTSFFDTGF